jgi:hypothetical protein
MTVSAICLSFPVQHHSPVHHNRHVPTFAQKLHHLFARSCQLRPTGVRLRVLLQPTNLVAVEHEIDLPQAFPWSDADRIVFLTQLNHSGVLDENLPPDIN